MRIRVAFAAIAGVALVVGSVRLAAITYGFVDTNHSFGNTGAFIVKSPTTGQITGDAVCRSTNTAYRLDTASARRFLSPFVALP